MVSQSPDMKISLETLIRAPSAVPVDDAVLPFEVDTLDLRGRLTRLGPALDDVLTKHDYPRAVGKLLGEAIVLTTLLGSSLKRVAVEQGISGMQPGSAATYAAMGHLLFDSLEEFQACWAPHAQAIVGDVTNYTNSEPLIQISEVKL